MKTEDIMNDETIASVVEAIADMNESKLKQAASFEELEKNIGWIKKAWLFTVRLMGQCKTIG